MNLLDVNISGFVNRAFGGDPAPRLERAITYLQQEGYDFLVDGARLSAQDELGVQVAARRLATSMRSARNSPESGVDIKTRTTPAQILRQSARELCAQLLSWQGQAGGAAAVRSLRKMEDVSGPEVLRLAQLVKDGSEPVLSLKAGQIQSKGGELKPYKALRFKPFPWGRWSISVHLLAELSRRSVLEKRTQQSLDEVMLNRKK